MAGELVVPNAGIQEDVVPVESELSADPPLISREAPPRHIPHDGFNGGIGVRRFGAPTPVPIRCEALQLPQASPNGVPPLDLASMPQRRLTTKLPAPPCDPLVDHPVPPPCSPQQAAGTKLRSRRTDEAETPDWHDDALATLGPGSSTPPPAQRPYGLHAGKPEGKPEPYINGSRALVEDMNAEDPLADVLDWLGRSDLSIKDTRSTAGEFEDDDATRYSEVQRAGTTSSLQDLFDDTMEETGPARAQEPRAWPPKTTNLPLGASVAALSRLTAICTGDPKAASQQSKLRSGDMRSEEDDEWYFRQQKTGTVGRLVIYAVGDNAADDVVLRGGFQRPLVVAAVRDSGPAAKAGVKAGDRLVSINGKKDFCGVGADAIRDQMVPPLMLVFLGFVGKLQAEVRLTCSQRSLGLSLRSEVTRGYVDAPLQICEETVFDPGLASLFMVVADRGELADDEEFSNTMAPMFELHRFEAGDIVAKALRKARLPENAITATRVDQDNDSRQTLACAPSKPGGDAGWVDDGTQGDVFDGYDPLYDTEHRPADGFKRRSQVLTTPRGLSPRDGLRSPRVGRELGPKGYPLNAKAVLPCHSSEPCIVYCFA